MNYRDDHYHGAAARSKEAEDRRLAQYQATHPTLHAREQLKRAQALLGKKPAKRLSIAGTAFKGSTIVINITKALIILVCAIATYQSIKDLLP